MEQYITYFFISFGVGYFLFVFFCKVLLPKKLTSDNRLQKNFIVNEAKQKARMMYEKEQESFDADMNSTLEELGIEIQTKTETLQIREQELDTEEESLADEEQRISRLETTVSVEKQLVDRTYKNLKDLKNQVKEVKNEICTKLAQISGDSLEQERKLSRTRIIEDASLESTKTIRYVEEELASTSKKNSLTVLNSIVSRINLKINSSKNINHSEVTDPAIKNVVLLEDNEIFTVLRELCSGVSIEASPGNDPSKPVVVKFSGGYGIDREAARLSFETLIKKGLKERGKLPGMYSDIKKHLEKKSFELGKRAADQLGISDIHKDLLMMVGALNWRTSYRQNQYVHSLEVATLSGIVAGELGLDVKTLKRCGLLHDIGKGLDYKLEGSHAIISADYADRYGESRTVCDVILAHHSDIVLETPESYALITADTLSGARPGSRINIEEGYQERLSALYEVVKSFPAVSKVEIMYGAREVHVDVNYKAVSEDNIQKLVSSIVKKIEEKVSYPGQIKVIVTRRFEVSCVA